MLRCTRCPTAAPATRSWPRSSSAPAPPSTPAEFVEFLESQLDLGTKWAPRYVRIVEALPLTGTNKLNKQPLKAARWDTTDPLWHRPGRDLAYVPMTSSDRAALEAEFEANDRQNLLR